MKQYLSIFHPVSWAQNWPKDAKPYSSPEIAAAHGHDPDMLIESPYSGPAALVIDTPPAPEVTKEEEKFIAENPGTVVQAVVPDEPVVQDQSVAQAPASAKTQKPSKKKAK